MNDDFVHQFLRSPEAAYNEMLELVNNHKFTRDQDWNTEYRAKLQEAGLCLRYKKTRPYHINAPQPAMGHRHQWPRGMFIVELSPLHPLQDEDWYEDQGFQGGMQADPDRHTGRTTAIALRIIHDSICNPEVPIDIIDHTAYRKADQQLANTIRWMIQDLKLRHMYVEVSKRDEYTLIFQRRFIEDPNPLK